MAHIKALWTSYSRPRHFLERTDESSYLHFLYANIQDISGWWQFRKMNTRQLHILGIRDLLVQEPHKGM